MLQLALIGCGAVSTAILELLRNDPHVRVAALVVPEATVEKARRYASRVAPDLPVVSALPRQGIDFVLEAASHSALREHVLPALTRGIPCVIASVGALSEPGLAELLEAAAREGGTRIHIIAGAIGGIDALAAASLGGLDHVRYTGRKPPRAWKGSPAESLLDLDSLNTATVVFEGSAREASKLYAKNANVAATISLAGLGLDRTQVLLIADPGIDENIHMLQASGAFGSMELTMRNKTLAANPKTSALTVYSAVRAVRNCAATLCI